MADANQIYRDIQSRTGGNIYVGVVGPVRSGKSTFIKRFLDTIVLPHIAGEFEKARAIDEMPQSASGKTIMTTEPKFVPEKAVEVSLGEGTHLQVRLVDCVGFVVPSAIGYVEEEAPRMVKTPWSEEEIPFHMAAEIGTKKVITEHSTIGLVISTDGSFTDIPREEYALAEERVIAELRSCNKPFVMVLNTTDAKSPQALELASALSAKYNISVVPMNCKEADEEQIKELLRTVLLAFPVSDITIAMPRWIQSLNRDHWFKKALLENVAKTMDSITLVREVGKLSESLKSTAFVQSVVMKEIDLSTGSVKMKIKPEKGLFYRILEENTGLAVDSEQALMQTLEELSDIKTKYQKVKNALEEVENTGYGIVMPDPEELSLEEPELMKQGGRYGVRLKASAPSIHMIRADIMTEVAPIVGSESQSEDLVLYLMKQFEENPREIWNSDIFGKSIFSIVTEGLNSKLSHMPTEARAKFRETIEKVINEGCNGLICIIL